MVKAVFAGSDYRDHEEIRAATSAWLRRRNAEARRDQTSARPPETADAPVGPPLVASLPEGSS